jgi:hypothetical protein
MIGSALISCLCVLLDTQPVIYSSNRHRSHDEDEKKNILTFQYLVTEPMSRDDGLRFFCAQSWRNDSPKIVPKNDAFCVNV